MSSQVLARKWRPRSFSSLVGQDHVVRALTHALKTQRLHHAYLFTGTRGVGKTTIARILAKSLNCETGITPEPCGQCSACLEVDAGRYPDYIEMDAASNRGVNEMAQVLDAAVYAPTAGRFKVYVIDEVHMLTTTAFNAMLKTLEEPPAHIVFILATTDPQKVPVTVLSRCLQFGLKNMPSPSIVDHAAKILGQEGVEFDEGALQLIARAARGSMRDALSLLDQAIAFGGGRVNLEQTSQMLGTVNRNELMTLLSLWSANDGAGLIQHAEHLHGSGVPVDQVLSDLAQLLYQVALAKHVPLAAEADSDFQVINGFANAIDPVVIQALYQIAIFAQRDLSLAPDPLSGLSMALMRMLAFKPINARDVPRINRSSPVIESSAASDRSDPPQLKTNGPVQLPAATGVAVEPLAQVTKSSIGLTFDGHWPKLAAAVPLSGMARQLATTSELIRFEGDAFEIRVALKPLADAQHVAKLRDALSEHFGRPVKLQVSVGNVAGATASKVADENRAKRLAAATQSVQEDPTIQTLQKEFGATIVPGSIRAIED